WFKYYKLAFAVRSIIYGSLLLRFWAKAKYGFNVQHVMVVQAYAYLTAIKDRLLGIELLWAASGDRKAHKRNKYRNMGILYWLWTIVNFGGVVAAVTYYWLLSGFPWYQKPSRCLCSTCTTSTLPTTFSSVRGGGSL
ncbi:uncharacterized protein P884DRAFT_304024, partial [Thermothelomyces heterothallicus CBS 202.75]|uniref:uncharacterized protein n=1 Tax=Thermothelomyces heterothallicus CBS 202.75 TaxID=1149848 RepID=UPI0037437D4B